MAVTTRTKRDLKTENTELVQTRISKKAKGMLKERCRQVARSEAAYVRRLIYRDLGIVIVTTTEEI